MSPEVARMLLAETDWTVIIAAVGSAAVLVTGAIGREVYKVAAGRWAADRDKAAADEKARKEAAAVARRDKRDASDELYRLLDIKEKDAADWREQVHELRNEMAVMSNRLAVCEWDRRRMGLMLEDQGAALQKAGIPVLYRPTPDPPPGEPAGPRAGG